MVSPQIHHRLNRKNISGLYFGTLAGLPIIWYLGVFVHAAPNSMANVLAHDGVTAALGVLLHGGADVPKVLTGPALLNRKFQTFLGDPNQRQPIVAHLADGNGRRGIANEPFKRYTAIDRENVPLECVRCVSKRSP